MLKKTMQMMLVTGLALTVGCASMTETQKWAAGGAVLGAGVGAVAGEVGAGLSTAEAALVGASVGGLGGALIGDQREQAQINELIAQKDAEIEAANERARQAERKLASAMEDIAALEREVERLNAALADCQGAKTEVSLLADVLFKPGSAQLSSQGKDALRSAGEKLKAEMGDRHLTVEGHTDKQPIRASNWKSNWELGAARSLTVLHFLIDEVGIDPARCSAETFSKYQPVSDDMAQNRRAVLKLQ